MFDSKKGSCCVSTNWCTDQTKITLHKTRMIRYQHSPFWSSMLDTTFIPNTRKMLVIIPVGSVKTKRSFSSIRWIHKWLRSGMTTNLLGGLAINAVYGSMIIILKTSIYIVYMGIHPQKEMAYSFFIYTWFMRYLRLIEFIILIFDFFQNLNLTTRSLGSGNFILIGL